MINENYSRLEEDDYKCAECGAELDHFFDVPDLSLCIQCNHDFIARENEFNDDWEDKDFFDEEEDIPF